MPDDSEVIQSFGFGEPVVQRVDLGSDLALPGLVYVRVYFPATEPEMVVRCEGGTGVAAIVPVPEEDFHDGSLDEDAYEDVFQTGAAACLEQLTGKGAT